MAVVNVVSFKIRSFNDAVKSMPLYFPSGLTLAYIQQGVTDFAPVIDAAIDGVIDAVTVELQLTLPGGLKATPDDGNTVHEGALLNFDAASTNYSHGIFVPSWCEDGFSADQVVGSGVWQTLIDDLVSGLGTISNELKPSDRYGNDLVALNSGVRKFRK